MENLWPPPWFWMENIIAGAVALQTIELLQIRGSFGATGIWSWSVIRRELAGLPRALQAPLDSLLRDAAFPKLLWLRLICAFVAPFLGSTPFASAIWAFLLISSVLIAVRWRGTFNGGSDYMTIIVLSAVFVGHAFGPSHPRWLILCLGYVALQVCLSYFIAGIAKLRHHEWRNGQALQGFLRSNYYGVPGWIRSEEGIADRRWLMVVGGWAILAFECAFPVALINPRICSIMIGLALAFQLANVFLFGLNRFLWAWGAAYPALYACSAYFSQAR